MVDQSSGARPRWSSSGRWDTKCTLVFTGSREEGTDGARVVVGGGSGAVGSLALGSSVEEPRYGRGGAPMAIDEGLRCGGHHILLRAPRIRRR